MVAATSSTVRPPRYLASSVVVGCCRRWQWTAKATDQQREARNYSTKDQPRENARACKTPKPRTDPKMNSRTEPTRTPPGLAS